MAIRSIISCNGEEMKKHTSQELRHKAGVAWAKGLVQVAAQLEQEAAAASVGEKKMSNFSHKSLTCGGKNRVREHAVSVGRRIQVLNFHD